MSTGMAKPMPIHPPLREALDVEALIAALKDGTIDCIATDHAPHSSLEKDCEFSAASPGLMGLELCFSLLRELAEREGILPFRLIDAMSTAPARIAGLEPPSLREGSSAELVLFDPEHTWIPKESRLHSKARNTPFLSRKLSGKVTLTLARGRIVFDGVEHDEKRA